MLLRYWCCCDNNDSSSDLSYVTRKTPRFLFLCLEKLNISDIKIKVNSCLCLNNLQNVLGVGWYMWESVLNNSEAIVYSNTGKSNR